MVYEAYNLTNINGSGLVPLTQTVNTELMLGTFGILLLITIGVMIFMAFIVRNADWKKSLGITTLIVAVFGILLRNINLVDDKTVLITWIFAGVAAGLSFMFPD